MEIIIKLVFPENLIEQIIHGIMDNYPEAGNGNSLYCAGWDYDALEFTFVEGDEEKTHQLTKDKLISAFPLLFSDKWPKGLTRPPTSDSWEVWENWLCDADACYFDAFVQLAIFGEVIYG